MCHSCSLILSTHVKMQPLQSWRWRHFHWLRNHRGNKDWRPNEISTVKGKGVPSHRHVHPIHSSTMCIWTTHRWYWVSELETEWECARTDGTEMDGYILWPANLILSALAWWVSSLPSSRPLYAGEEGLIKMCSALCKSDFQISSHERSWSQLYLRLSGWEFLLLARVSVIRISHLMLVLWPTNILSLYCIPIEPQNSEFIHYQHRSSHTLRLIATKKADVSQLYIWLPNWEVLLASSEKDTWYSSLLLWWM